MKRLFTLLFSIAFICQAFGYDIEINGIYYYVTSDENRTLEVTSGTNCYTGEVIISTLVPYSGSTYRVTSISDWAFWNCKALTNISIPIAVTSIGESAFGYCCNLTDVYVNWSEPLEISLSVFDDVDLSKATLHVPTGTKTLYEAADVWKDFGTIVEEMPNNEIWYTSSDRSIVIPQRTDIFGAKIVSNTYENGLGKIVFDIEVTRIGNYAFYCCDNLTSIDIPSSVTNIREMAFAGCASLTGITIPKRVSEIQLLAFIGCLSLTNITVEEGNTTYDSRNNCNAIIETASKKLVTGCQNTVIPSGVISIELWAFLGCVGLTSITIPSSMCEIDELAFDGCSGLAEIIVEAGNKTYDSRNDCDAIIETETNTLIAGCKNTVIPGSVTSIGNNAFCGHTSLTSINIPSTVSNIGEDVFAYNQNLTDVYVNWSEPLEIPSSVFYDVDLPKATLHVPTGTKALYEAADVWKDFGTIVEDEGTSLRSVKDNKASDGLFYRLDGTRYNAVPAKGQILIQWGKKGRIASGL